MRIVSLLPSATEIVCGLGLEDALVGISGDCDYPPSVRGTPVLSGAVVSAGLASREIDSRIRSQVHRGLSVYHLDAAELTRIHPDLILTQELCEVCAPSYTQVLGAAKILDADARIVSLEPRGLDDVLETIALVGEATGRQEAAAALAAALRARIGRVREAVRGRPRPRVACLEWLDPIFAAGHWVPEMIEAAGGLDVLGTARAPSREVGWEAVREARPDVVVVAACGFDVARTTQEMHLLTGRAGWEDLPAVRGGRAYVADGSAYFSRPGPRLADGVEILAAIVHDLGVPTPPGAFERAPASGQGPGGDQQSEALQ